MNTLVKINDKTDEPAYAFDQLFVGDWFYNEQGVLYVRAAYDGDIYVGLEVETGIIVAFEPDEIVFPVAEMEVNVLKMKTKLTF